MPYGAKESAALRRKCNIDSYELNDSALQSDLKVKVFPEKASVEWLLFVDANRDRKNQLPVHDYDFVVDPTTDDSVVLQLTNYRKGICSPDEAARLLQDRYLDQQYCLGIEIALSCLHKTNVETI